MSILGEPVDDKKNEIFTISHPKLYFYITNNAGIILLILFIIMYLLAFILQVDFSYLKRLSFLIFICSLFGIIFLKFFDKVAWKIIFDYSKREINFYMCRDKKVKKYDFISIRDIKQNNYTKFILPDENILCNFGKENELIKNINRIKSIIEIH